MAAKGRSECVQLSNDATVVIGFESVVIEGDVNLRSERVNDPDTGFIVVVVRTVLVQDFSMPITGQV